MKSLPVWTPVDVCEVLSSMDANAGVKSSAGSSEPLPPRPDAALFLGRTAWVGLWSSCDNPSTRSPYYLHVLHAQMTEAVTGAVLTIMKSRDEIDLHMVRLTEGICGILGNSRGIGVKGWYEVVFDGMYGLFEAHVKRGHGPSRSGSHSWTDPRVFIVQSCSVFPSTKTCCTSGVDDSFSFASVIDPVASQALDERFEARRHGFGSLGDGLEGTDRRSIGVLLIP